MAAQSQFSIRGSLLQRNPVEESRLYQVNPFCSPEPFPNVRWLGPYVQQRNLDATAANLIWPLLTNRCSVDLKKGCPAAAWRKAQHTHACAGQSRTVDDIENGSLRHMPILFWLKSILFLDQSSRVHWSFYHLIISESYLYNFHKEEMHHHDTSKQLGPFVFKDASFATASAKRLPFAEALWIAFSIPAMKLSLIHFNYHIPACSCVDYCMHNLNESFASLTVIFIYAKYY